MMIVEKNGQVKSGPLFDGAENANGVHHAVVVEHGTGGHYSGSVVQLKFHSKCLTIWKRRFRDRDYSYRLSAVDLMRRDSEVVLELDHNQDSASLTEDSPSDAQLQISVLNDMQFEFTKQEQFGRVYDPDEYVIIKARVADTEKIAFMVDFYMDNRGSIPEHMGFCYILPNNLPDSNGTCTMPITGTKRQPIGQLSVEYLIIRPLPDFEDICNMNEESAKPAIDSPLDVGHRGAGNARRSDKVENVLENTVASFNYAAAHGADMVELDVQLSKDKIPVVYHDFYINISMKKKKCSLDEYLQVAVKDLTHSQLGMLKLRPLHGPELFLDDDPHENQPFPALEHVLEAVDDRVGFNIELKYPMFLRDGKMDGAVDRHCDINNYVDIILATIMNHAGNRKIILSCFHPDICTLLQLKQRRYPLLFLTQGQTEKYPAYLDPRTRSIKMATHFTQSLGCSGINVHAEEILKDRSLVAFVKQRNLALFCWGEDLNATSVIKQLQADGVDGLIYDKVDEYSPKHSLFVAESREHRKSLIGSVMDSGQVLDSNMSGLSWGSTSSSL